MSDDKPKITVGDGKIGFCGLLFIVLLVLKVGVFETSVTTWSWWLITCPLWGPMAILLLILTVVGICYLPFAVGGAVTPNNRQLLEASFPEIRKERKVMGTDSFCLMLFKDADKELQRRYPNALWFALATKGMSSRSLEQLEAALVKMRRRRGISFTPQNEEFNGQLVWIGEASVFGGLV